MAGVGVFVVAAVAYALWWNAQGSCNPDAFCFGELVLDWDEPLPEVPYSVQVCVDSECGEADALSPGESAGPGRGALILDARRFRYTRGIAITPGPHDVVFRLVAEDGTVVFDFEDTVVFEPNSCTPEICASARVKLDLGDG